MMPNTLLQIMINAKAFINTPIPFEELCFIYPPKVKDVINNDEYGAYRYILTLSAEDIYDELNKKNINSLIQTLPSEGPPPIHLTQSADYTPLEYLLINCYHNKQFLHLTENAFQLFTHCDIIPLYDQKAIYIGDLPDKLTELDFNHLPLLTNDNFLLFQNKIRESIGAEPVELPDPDEDPRITRMKAKARYRDRVKAKHGEGLSFESMLVAICCMGIGITPLNIGEMSCCSVTAILNTYQNKERYDIDIRSLLAGADSKKIKPKYWITN